MLMVTGLLLQQRRADKSPNGAHEQLAEERHETTLKEMERGFKGLRDLMNGNHRITEKAARLRHRRVIQQIVAVPDETLKLYQDVAKQIGKQESA